MKFDYSPMFWGVSGTKPPESIQNEGWLAGHKPPAAYFNYKWRADYLSINELQQKLAALDDTHAADKAALEAAIVLKAPLDSPTFTGKPKAPTPSNTSNGTEIATTAFVQGLIGGIDLSDLASKTVYQANANLNTLLDDKSYICAGALTNAPIPTTYCVLRCWDTSSTDRVVQQCFVPDLNTNAVRTFVRSVNAGVSFGSWREFATSADVNDVNREIDVLKVLLNEDKFRNKATLAAMNHAVFTLFLETFETLDDIDTSAGSGETAITAAYDEYKHIFTNAVEGTTLTLQSTAKEITGPNNTAWCYPDWEGGGNSELVVSMSRDGGTTWTEVYRRASVSGNSKGYLTSIADQPTGVQVIVKVTLVGVTTLKNLAWGVK